MKKIVVIGGGVMGLCSAYYLQKAGCKVTLVDRDEESASFSASYGNAGMLSPSHYIPLAAPGVITKGLKWMLDSTSPFYIRPRLNSDLVSWGIKFMQSATKENVIRASHFLMDLNLVSCNLYFKIKEDEGFDFELKSNGLLMIFKTRKAKKKEEETAFKSREMGLKVNLLSKDEVHAIEPALRNDVIGAAQYLDDGSIAPWKFMDFMKKYLRNNGVLMHYSKKIEGFRIENEKVQCAYSGINEFEADEFVIAGGIWSMEMAKKLNFRLPMQGGKGYNITIDKPQTKINYPAVLAEANTAVTPFNNKLRIAGTMEISGYDLSITQKRVDTIIQRFSEYYRLKDLPAFKKQNPWAGLRPVSPDGLPYIGRLSSYKNISVCTGHAMMGLSLGPISGKLISEIITETPSDFNLSLVSPGRFS